MAAIQKRGSSWRAMIRKTGYPVKSNTFPTKAMAQRWARDTERAMDRQEWNDPDQIKDITLADLLKDYEAEVDPITPFNEFKYRQNSQRMIITSASLYSTFRYIHTVRNFAGMCAGISTSPAVK